jgi:hypothetical protein
VPVSEPIPTRILTQMVPRMQRTHDRRRASFFVGPPGIGKSTAIAAFAAANGDSVMVSRITKRGVTGPQALQSMLLALRARVGHETRYVTNATSEVQRYIAVEIEKAGYGRRRDEDAALFPKLTIVFDEAQRLTNGAIDALRDWNEPHYYCAGTFPIGMIFVGNNELSLESGRGGTSILDEGMQDRLLYRERLTYEHVDRADLENFARSVGVVDDGAVAAIGAAFAGPDTQRSFRRLADFIDQLFDEAGDAPVTRETVRAVLSLI